MKKINSHFAVLLFSVCSFSASAQTINWRTIENQKQVVNLNAGYEYGFTIGAGYGYKINVKMPTLLSAEYSFPTGTTLFDDFKVRFGGQAEVFRIRNWSVTLRAFGIFRRYQNDLAVLKNFGSEFSTAFGYYKKGWYVAGEFGFDKAIVTRVVNSDVMKQNYPAVKDGWYIPTGGNFFYGIQTGLTLGRQDVYLKVGKMISQDLETAPAFPMYARLGLNYRF